MIVKVQRPVGYAAQSLPWRLVYAEGRRQARFKPTARMRRQVGERPEAFYEADLINGEWRFVRPIADQP
jgi:hypothetical protein